MPYRWKNTPGEKNLTLWPHRSLPRRGFAAIVLLAFTLITIPLYPLLGTVFVWGLLPFMLVTVSGLWWGLERSYQTGNMREDLSISRSRILLTRRNADGSVQTWQANPYWVRSEIHPNTGPVPFYITLHGENRTVEIGSFLSEDERKGLYEELTGALADIRNT